MNDWWKSISEFEKIFWYISIPFTVAFVVKSVLSFVGMDEEGDADDMEMEMDVEEVDFEELDMDEMESEELSSEDSIGLHILTIRNFIIFFAVFGWAGISGVHFGFSKIVTLFFASGFGFCTILVVAAIFYNISKLTESGTINPKILVNSTGSVYLRIPENNSGVGKVNINVGGALKEFDAQTAGPEIPTGDEIVIIDVMDNGILLVEKLE